MIAKISNYRGIADATLDITSIALVAGSNGAGKSSICQAIGAALTGEPVPVTGVKKTSAGVLVRSGTAAGKIVLENAAGSVTVDWPSAKVKTTGQPPTASLYAAGLKSIVAMDDKERVPFLIDYLKAQPTKDDLARAVKPLDLGEGTFNRLWEIIQANGWDGAYLQIKEKGAKLKGQWESVTNANYGSKAAESWIPEGYSPELMGSSEDTLQRCVTDANDTLEAAIASSAVDESERERLQGVADLYPQRKIELADARFPLPPNPELNGIAAKMASARISVADCQKELDDARRVLDGLPIPDKPEMSYECPCCKERLKVIRFTSPEGYSLEKWKPSDPAAVTKRQTAIDAQREKIKGISSRLVNLTENRDALELQHRDLSSTDVTAQAEHLSSVREAERLVKESEDAQASLGREIMAGQGKPIEECRKDLAAAQLRLKAFTAKHEADRLHASVTVNQELLSHIAPGGVRADVLTKALTGFNAVMGELSAVAKWGKVQIEGDFSFSYSGTPYYLCSQSEQYRVRVIVQVAMAVKECSSMVVIDGADILDKAGRNGLFKLLMSRQIAAVIGMTIEEDAVPNLAKSGTGRSYWIGAGSVAREV